MIPPAYSNLNFPTNYTPHTYPCTISPYLATSYVNFLANVYSFYDPCTYNEAKQSKEWVQAMDQELEALENNKTWHVTNLPPGKQAIGSKWAYRVKYHPDGSVDRYKARLVAKGSPN